MKVALLGDAQSVHTIRWVNGLASKGIEVHLFTIHPLRQALRPGVVVHMLSIKAPLGYVLAGRELKRLLIELNPDILNAHFASGYGLLARLSGFKPLLMSVWGSDVYDFPRRSKLHRCVLQRNLAAATAIGSTSHCMARASDAVWHHPYMYITPFGIDEKAFAPLPSKPPNTLVIGTVKSLRTIYGIDVLLDAFSRAVKMLEEFSITIRLEITGDGPDMATLQDQADSLGIGELVTFHGAVPYARVPEMLNRLDVYVALSREESFGVAILEAAACEIPVVVSDAEGLAEVTNDGINGLIVPRDDPQAAADSIVTLCRNSVMRTQFGKAGRVHVLENYTWEKSLESMVDAYTNTINIFNEQSVDAHRSNRE